MTREVKELYEFGDFRLDVGEHKLTRLNGPTNGSIPEKAFRTLVHLVRNCGTLVTKDELLETVWPDVIVEENNLAKAIFAIRRFLDDLSENPKYIETVPKYGYRFIADIRSVGRVGIPAAAENGSAAKNPNLSRHKPPSQSWSKRSYVKTVAVVLLIGAIGLGVWFVMNRLKTAETPVLSASNSEASSSRNMATVVHSPAYELYVRGKVKVASENREDIEAAIRLLEEAVAIDPNFAEAHAQLARGYITMGFKYSSDSERKRFHESAEVAIEKALALNPNLAEGHLARGQILWTNTKRFPHEQAIQSYKRSLALNPNLDETHHLLSLVYSHIGLLDEAEQSVKKALEINPNNTLARFRIGVYMAYQGKFDDAIIVFKTIPSDFNPLLVDRSTAEVLIQTGRLKEAEAITDDYLRRFPQDEGGSFTSVKALILAKRGNRKGAKDAISRSIEIGKGFGHFHHTAYNIASAYASLNELEKALEWLETAADDGFPCYSYFKIDPNLDNLRAHPRFIELITALQKQSERFKQIA